MNHYFFVRYNKEIDDKIVATESLMPGLFLDINIGECHDVRGWLAEKSGFIDKIFSVYFSEVRYVLLLFQSC